MQYLVDASGKPIDALISDTSLASCFDFFEHPVPALMLSSTASAAHQLPHKRPRPPSPWELSFMDGTVSDTSASAPVGCYSTRMDLGGESPAIQSSLWLAMTSDEAPDISSNNTSGGPGVCSSSPKRTVDVDEKSGRPFKKTDLGDSEVNDKTSSSNLIRYPLVPLTEPKTSVSALTSCVVAMENWSDNTEDAVCPCCLGTIDPDEGFCFICGACLLGSTERSKL